MKTIALIISATALLTHARAQQPNTPPAKLQPAIPASITQVQRHSVDQSVIRIITRNLETEPDAPLVTIERFSIPGMQLAEQLLISRLEVNGKMLDFNECTDVTLKSLKVQDSQMHMVVEFTPLRASGPEWVKCTMSLKNNKLGAMNSHSIQTPP